MVFIVEDDCVSFVVVLMIGRNSAICSSKVHKLGHVVQQVLVVNVFVPGLLAFATHCTLDVQRQLLAWKEAAHQEAVRGRVARLQGCGWCSVVCGSATGLPLRGGWLAWDDGR